jgi:hypothetical protein
MVANGRDDGYKDVFVFYVDGQVVGLLPTLVTVFSHSLHEVNDVFVDCSEGEVPQQDVHVLSKYLGKLRNLLHLAVPGLLLCLTVPLTLAFANPAESPLPALHPQFVPLEAVPSVEVRPFLFRVEQMGQNLVLEVDFQPVVNGHMALPVVHVGDIWCFQGYGLGLFEAPLILDHREEVPVDDSGGDN